MKPPIQILFVGTLLLAVAVNSGTQGSTPNLPKVVSKNNIAMKQSASKSLYIGKTFSCGTTNRNDAGQLFLDEAVYRAKINSFILQSWGIRNWMVSLDDVPRIVANLLPRLREKRQRILLTVDSSTLVPFTKQPIPK